MSTRRQVAAWFHAVAASLLLAAVTALWVAAALLAPLFEGSFVPELVAMFGRPVAVALMVFALLELAGAWGMLHGRRWAMRVLFVVSLFQFAIVPVGTALAVFTWWAIAVPGRPGQGEPD